MSNTHQYRAPEERPLTMEERTLLEWLIAHGVPNASRYSSQIPRAKVVSRCTCGCPTIDLAVDGKQMFGPSEIIADVFPPQPLLTAQSFVQCQGLQVIHDAGAYL